MNGTNSSAKHQDMVAMGSGAAGHHGAIHAAKLGKEGFGDRTLRSSWWGQHQHRHDSKQGASGGCQRSSRSGSADRRISASHLAQRSEEVASKEVPVFESHFRRNEIDVLIGTASFARPLTIRVANQEAERFYNADHVLIATGSRPAHHEAIPMDGICIIVTDAIRPLKTEHHMLIIVGGLDRYRTWIWGAMRQLTDLRVAEPNAYQFCACVHCFLRLTDQVQGRGYALTSRLDRRNGSFACGHSVRKRRFSSTSRMIDDYCFGPATEKGEALLHSIKRNTQFGDHDVGFISRND